MADDSAVEVRERAKASARESIVGHLRPEEVGEAGIAIDLVEFLEYEKS